MAKKTINRRDFIKAGTSAVIAGAISLGGASFSMAQEKGKSRVILIRRQDLWQEPGRPRPEVVQEMLDEAVKTIFNEKDPLSAWKKVIKPSDTVGIKTNSWAGLPTPPAVENAIRKRVLACGVAESSVSVNDRGVRKDPVFLKATVLINARPMRAHAWAGVGTCIKNYIQFVEKPSDYHPDSCADLATVWKLPMVKDKTRLNILVLFTPVFHILSPRGIDPTYMWQYNGLAVGVDPVSVDATGVRIVEAKRREHFGDDRPLNPPAKHIFLADTRHGVGNSDAKNIELIKLGWQENLLI